MGENDRTHRLEEDTLHTSQNQGVISISLQDEPRLVNLNTVEITVLSVLICEFNVIPFKSSTPFFLELMKLTVKSIWKNKKAKIGQENLEI